MCDLTDGLHVVLVLSAGDSPAANAKIVEYCLREPPRLLGSGETHQKLQFGVSRHQFGRSAKQGRVARSRHFTIYSQRVVGLTGIAQHPSNAQECGGPGRGVLRIGRSPVQVQRAVRISVALLRRFAMHKERA